MARGTDSDFPPGRGCAAERDASLRLSRPLSVAGTQAQLPCVLSGSRRKEEQRLPGQSVRKLGLALGDSSEARQRLTWRRWPEQFRKSRAKSGLTGLGLAPGPRLQEEWESTDAPAARPSPRAPRASALDPVLPVGRFLGLVGRMGGSSQCRPSGLRCPKISDDQEAGEAGASAPSILWEVVCALAVTRLEHLSWGERARLF